MTVKSIGKALFGTADRPTYIPELARKTGLNRATLYNYRKHPETIPVSALVLIADALRLKEEDLR